MFFAIELFELIIILSLFHVITFWLAFPKRAMNTQWTPNEQSSFLLEGCNDALVPSSGTQHGRPSQDI